MKSKECKCNKFDKSEFEGCQDVTVKINSFRFNFTFNLVKLNYRNKISIIVVGSFFLYVYYNIYYKIHFNVKIVSFLNFCLLTIASVYKN